MPDMPPFVEIEENESAFYWFIYLRYLSRTDRHKSRVRSGHLGQNYSQGMHSKGETQ